MKFNAAVAVSAAAILAGNVHAEEAEKPASKPELATFTVSQSQQFPIPASIRSTAWSGSLRLPRAGSSAKLSANRA